MTFQDDNGNQLEFNGEFAMTKRAVSFFNGDIKGDVSINFTVENNSVNRKVLGYFGPQMTSQVAWTKQAFNRIRNGNIIDRGYIVIQNEDGNKLSCFYVSGNSNWIQLINGLITDLDYTGAINGTNYNTLIDTNSVVSKTGATSGIIFPYVDWIFNLKGAKTTSTFMYTLTQGVSDSTSQYTNLFYFYPCFYLSSLVNEICTQNSIKISGNLVNDPIYNSFVVTPSNGIMKKPVFKNIILGGVSTAIGAAPSQVNASLTEISDPERLFSGNRFIANRDGYVILTTNTTSVILGNKFLQVFKNSVETLDFTLSTGLIQSAYIILRKGDILDFYLLNASGGATNITTDLKISYPDKIVIGDYVNPGNFLPSISCLDIIKMIINYFGCSAYFDQTSKTITCNIIEKIKPESSSDWSEYFQSVRSEYTVNQAKNNYIRLDDPDESVLKNYNSSRLTKYGEGNIITGNTLKTDNDLFKFPFAPSSFGQSLNSSFLCNVPLVDLQDSESFTFTAITDNGDGTVTLTMSLDSNLNNYEIVKISSTNSTIGYAAAIRLSPTQVIVYMDFTSSYSGYLTRQIVNYNDVGFRLLTVNPSVNVSSVSELTSLKIKNNAVDQTVTTIPYAVFAKSVTGKSIDQWKNNLAIDNPDSGGFNDPTIKQLYFNKISKFLQNPNIRCKMLLPESVYQSFAFDQFIYLKTKNLTGYFFVDSIVNYIDANTPVEVNLYML